MSRTLKLLPALALAAALIGSITHGSSLPALAQAKEPLPAVVVAPVVSKPISDSVEFIGQTEAFQQVDLRARVTGFLMKRNFEEGADVKTGELLYSIDQAEYKAQRDAAEAKVERVEATIRETERQLKRYAELERRGTASVAKLDEAKARAGEARADLAAAKAELEEAQINLGYTQIESPIDGRVGRSAIDVGNLVGPDSGVLSTVVTLDPVRVTFAVSEREYLDYQKRLKSGETEKYTPRIRLANGDLYKAGGKIDFVDNKVDPTTGTLQLRAAFPNPEKTILPGQFVNVVLVSEKPQDRIVVPQAAVQQNQAGPFVLVVDGDSTVEARSITTGARYGPEIVVTKGLKPGEQIIVEGIQKVRPGAKVKAVPASEAEPAAEG